MILVKFERKRNTFFALKYGGIAVVFFRKNSYFKKGSFE